MRCSEKLRPLCFRPDSGVHGISRHTDHDKGELYADTLKKAKGKWQDRTAVEAYKHAYAAPEAATATSASAGAKHEDPENKKL